MIQEPDETQCRRIVEQIVDRSLELASRIGERQDRGSVAILQSQTVVKVLALCPCEPSKIIATKMTRLDLTRLQKTDH